MLKNIAVFCGASKGKGDKYLKASEELGCKLGRAGLNMIYGGAKVGTMGAVASGATANGSEVTGVFPVGFEGHCVQEFDIKDLVADDLHELIYTEDFFSRVSKMMELSDACIVCPGGIGTLHEFLSYTLYTQLRFHDKPVFVYNLNGYYDNIEAMLDKVVEEEFMKPADRKHVTFCSSADDLIKAILSFKDDE